jgi:hypothetical protein
VQRNQISLGIHQYATEMGNIQEERRSEEENCFMELRKMIDEGHFFEVDIQVDIFTAASVQSGRFPIKSHRPMRCQKEDCWVLVAEERMGGAVDDVGKHDLWILCARDLVEVHWFSQRAQERRELKLVIGMGQQVSVVATSFGETSFQEGKLESVEGSTDADVDIVPSLLRPDTHNAFAGQKPNMISPVRCTVCTCMEMSLPELGDDCVLFVPCLKIGRHA